MKVLSMARHKKHPEHENLERWLVSYADFITLLFATFTALYAIAQSKLTDDNKAADEIKKSFQQETLLKGIASVFQGQSTPTDKPNPAFEETGKGEGVVGKYESLILTHGEKKQMEELLEELDEVANELQQYIEQALSSPSADFDEAFDDLAGVPLRGLEVTLQERGVKISFDSRLLFPSGSAELNKKSIRFLDQVASRLLKSTPTHLVHIEGHTDSSPITGRYPSNWELSSARACAVVRHFINQHKFNPTDLAAIGYAESRPVTSNSSSQNRAKNRRIDIVLHSREQEQQVDPIPEARREKVLIDNTHRYSIENKAAKEATPRVVQEIPKPKRPNPKPHDSLEKKAEKKAEKKPKKKTPSKGLKILPIKEEIHIPIYGENGEVVNKDDPA
jgi:chemotaxis protein MotB